MSMIYSRGGAKQLSITAVVTRANGTVEDLGVISYWHKNPFKRLAWGVSRLFRRFIKGHVT